MSTRMQNQSIRDGSDAELKPVPQPNLNLSLLKGQVYVRLGDRFKFGVRTVPNACGFTLIEFLVAAAIMSIISLAVVAMFASGLRVYEKVQNYVGLRADVLIALEKIERDVRNVVSSSSIEFIGDHDDVSFAAITNEGGLGRIMYYVKGRYDVLTREEQAYARASASKIRKNKGDVTKLVSVKDIDFSYYYYHSDMKEYKWKNKWDLHEDEDDDVSERKISEEERVPLGIKVELTFREGQRDITLTRTVLIPIGDKGPLIKEEF